MAQYNFEGDFENINERQLEFINEVIQEQDLEATKVVFSPVGQAGDNFVANVKRINIEGKNGSMKMIVKIASSFEMVRHMTNTQYLFKNEHTMYTEVLPKLVKLQKDAGVPEEEQLKFAKCYGSLNEVPNEVVILQDLKELDFVMMNKFESLSNECVLSILKNFALLHSLCYVLKNKEPETYDLFKSTLTDAWVLMAENNAEIMGHMHIFQKEIQAVFDDEAHKSVIKDKITDIFKWAVHFSKTTDNRYSVIQQGDAWTNNIMFKFVGDELKQSIMIDYQASKNNSPVVDLLYMIFNCTDHETRSKNYYNWLDYYHSELDKSLSIFGLKTSSVFPREQLDVDLKRYAEFLFGLSLMLANLLTRDAKEARKFMEARQHTDMSVALDAMKMDAMPDETMVRFKKRVIGLIDSFREFGLL